MDIIEQVAEMRAKEALEEGLEKGRHEGDEKAVKLFLSNTEFSADKIAELVRVPVSFVEQIKKELRRK